MARFESSSDANYLLAMDCELQCARALAEIQQRPLQEIIPLSVLEARFNHCQALAEKYEDEGCRLRDYSPRSRLLRAWDRLRRRLGLAHVRTDVQHPFNSGGPHLPQALAPGDSENTSAAHAQ